MATKTTKARILRDGGVEVHWYADRLTIRDFTMG